MLFWIGLTCPQDIVPATMSALQYSVRHPLCMVPCTEESHPMFDPAVGLSKPYLYIHCPIWPTLIFCLYCCPSLHTLTLTTLTLTMSI